VIRRRPTSNLTLGEPGGPVPLAVQIRRGAANLITDSQVQVIDRSHPGRGFAVRCLLSLVRAGWGVGLRGGLVGNVKMVPERLVHLPCGPQMVEQNSELPRHGDHGAFLRVLAPLPTRSRPKASGRWLACSGARYSASLATTYLTHICC